MKSYLITVSMAGANLQDVLYEAGVLGKVVHAIESAETEPAKLGHPATRNWWIDTAQKDLDKVLEKAGEYSAYDLELMGRVMADWHSIDPKYGTEAACLFYILGKVCRAIGTYREGKTPSDDTLLDISQYTMMARRIREVGQWP